MKKFLIFHLLMFFLISCSQKIPTPQKQIFLSNNPEIAPFIELLPMSFQVERRRLETNLFEVQYTLERIKNYKTSDTELNKFINDIENEISTNINCKIKEFHKYEEEIQPGDSAFYFFFESENIRENGILILSQGRIRQKLVFGSVNFDKKSKKKKAKKKKKSGNNFSGPENSQPINEKCIDLFQETEPVFNQNIIK